MAQFSSPYGLKIVKTQGGPITQAPERLILTANAAGNGLQLPNAQGNGAAIATPVANIYQNDPIYYDGGGVLRATIAGAPAGITGTILGTFQGVEYSDSSGKRTVSNKWVSPGLLPGSEVWFWHTSVTTADWIFEIQSSATLDQTAIGATYGITSGGTPNQVVGFSTAVLDASGASSNGALQIYALAYDQNLATAGGANNGYTPGTPTAGNNNWGDPFVNVYVKLARGQFTGTVTGF